MTSSKKNSEPKATCIEGALCLDCLFLRSLIETEFNDPNSQGPETITPEDISTTQGTYPIIFSSPHACTQLSMLHFVKLLECEIMPHAAPPIRIYRIADEIQTRKCEILDDNVGRNHFHKQIRFMFLLSEEAELDEEMMQLLLVGSEVPHDRWTVEKPGPGDCPNALRLAFFARNFSAVQRVKAPESVEEGLATVVKVFRSLKMQKQTPPDWVQSN